MANRTPAARTWLIAMILSGSIVVTLEFVQVPGFWGSYGIDVFGPPLVYIYIRGLSAADQPTKLGRLFTPELAFLAVVSVCFLAELAQFLRLYNKHFDPYDFLAYVSLLTSCYAIDRWLLNRQSVS